MDMKKAHINLIFFLCCKMGIFTSDYGQQVMTSAKNTTDVCTDYEFCIFLKLEIKCVICDKH